LRLVQNIGQVTPPSDKWSNVEALLPVRDFKAWHASTLLTFDAVVDAIGQIEAKQKEAAHG
jgi:NifU-like protein involved in Fe-S cluster formation